MNAILPSASWNACGGVCLREFIRISRPRKFKAKAAQQAKYYDQIAWFRDDLDLLTSERAGVIDFAGAVYKELTLRQMSYRVSDHFPIWVEFIIDRSNEQMAQSLGIDPGMPDPFNSIPDS